MRPILRSGLRSLTAVGGSGIATSSGIPNAAAVGGIEYPVNRSFLLFTDKRDNTADDVSRQIDNKSNTYSAGVLSNGVKAVRNLGSLSDSNPGAGFFWHEMYAWNAQKKTSTTIRPFMVGRWDMPSRDLGVIISGSSSEAGQTAVGGRTYTRLLTRCNKKAQVVSIGVGGRQMGESYLVVTAPVGVFTADESVTANTGGIAKFLCEAGGRIVLYGLSGTWAGATSMADTTTGLKTRTISAIAGTTAGLSLLTTNTPVGTFTAGEWVRANTGGIARFISENGANLYIGELIGTWAAVASISNVLGGAKTRNVSAISVTTVQTQFSSESHGYRVLDAIANMGSSRMVVMLNFASNGINAGQPAAVELAALDAWLVKWKPLMPVSTKIVVRVHQPRTTTFSAEHLLYRTGVRSRDKTTNINRIIDQSVDEAFDDYVGTTDINNVLFYYDGTHMNDGGCIRAAPYHDIILAELLGLLDDNARMARLARTETRFPRF